MPITAPAQPNEGGRYLASGAVQMTDEGRVEPGLLPYNQTGIWADDTLRFRVRGFRWISTSDPEILAMPGEETLIEFHLLRRSHDPSLWTGAPPAVWGGRVWVNEWTWSANHSDNDFIPSGDPAHITPRPPPTSVGGIYAEGADLLAAEWGYRIDYLGPRSDVIPDIGGPRPPQDWTLEERNDYYYNKQGYHNYRLRLTRDGEELIDWTAFWKFPPTCIELHCMHTARDVRLLDYSPWDAGGLAGLPLRSTIGPTCGGVAATWRREGAEDDVGVWPWDDAGDLDDWTGGGSYQIRRALAGDGATYNLEADAAASGGRLWSPVVDAADGLMMWRGWSYRICELSTQGDVLDMHTDPVTGVPWIAWWTGGAIYVTQLDNYATNSWGSAISVDDLDDCVGVGITGDGRVMYVSATTSDGEVYVWQSLDRGNTWGAAVTV